MIGAATENLKEDPSGVVAEGTQLQNAAVKRRYAVALGEETEEEAEAEARRVAPKAEEEEGGRRGDSKA